MHAEPLSLADAVRYHMGTPRNPMEIGIVLFLADRMTASELQQFVTQRLLTHARFRQRVAKAPFPRRPSWQDETEFSLPAHVWSWTGPELSDEELARQLAQRLSQRLSSDRSPWRMELFPLGGGSCALHLRVQHCLGDGLALVRLLCELADEPRPDMPRAGARSRAPRRATLPTPRAMVGKANELARTLLRTLTSPPDAAHDLHAPSGEKRVAWSSPLNLVGLSQLAALRGHHMTELVLAATADALAHELAAHGRSVPSRLRALVPTGASLGRRELGNHYASAFVDLVLDEPHPWRRIERISESSAKLRDGAQARLSRTMLGLTGWLSPPLMRSATEFMSRRASLVLSNVPGPAQPVRLFGHEVDDIVVFAPPAASIGVSFTLFGYGEKLRLGVETDAAIPLSPGPLVQRFEQALHALAATR